MTNKSINYRLKRSILIITMCVLTSAIGWIFAPDSSTAQEIKTTEMKQLTRKEKGLQVIKELSNNAGQPALDELQKEVPFLADATLEYALGDVWGRKVLDPKTHQIAAVAALAAQGTLLQMKIHANYALNLGVTCDELKEVIYLTTVYSGFPKALNAAGALKEVFDERDKKNPTKN